MTDEISRFEQFRDDFKRQPENMRSMVTSKGAYAAQETTKVLMKLQAHACRDLFVFAFGERLGEHYAEKFHNQHRGNLLQMFHQMGSEERFYLVYLASSDSTIFMYG